LCKQIRRRPREELFHVGGGGLALHEGRIAHDRLLQGDRGLDAADEVFAEGSVAALQGDLTGRAEADQLADHRIVVGRDGVARIRMAVDAHAVAAGGVVEADGAGAGREVARGILGVDPALDSVLGEGDVSLVESQLLAVGHKDLLLDEVDSSNLLGDGMFHLDAGVHLDEVVVALGVDEKLDRACVRVFGGLGGANCGLAHLFAEAGGEEGRRRLLDQLLVAALHGAVALAEVEGLAVRVGEDLELDVAGLLDVFFEINRAVAEGFFGLVAGDVVFLREGDVVVRDAHAAAAAAGDGFDDDRIADLAGDLDGLGLGGDWSVGAGDGGDLGFFDGILGDRFVAHHLDRLRLGADELDVTGLALGGEFGVFGKEAVARVDGVDVGDLGGGDDAVRAEIGIRTFGAADANGFVGKLHVKRLGIGLGVNSEGLDAELATGANDSESDFAAVGDEDLLDHGSKNELTAKAR
jgi:hypothetical protein